jgi:hypothetical protein
MSENMQALLLGILASILAAVVVSCFRPFFGKIRAFVLGKRYDRKNVTDALRFMDRKQPLLEYLKKLNDNNRRLVDLKIELVYKLITLIFIMMVWLIALACSYAIVGWLSDKAGFTTETIISQWILMVPLVGFAILGGVRFSRFMDLRFCIRYMNRNEIDDLDKLEKYLKSANLAKRKNENETSNAMQKRRPTKLHKRS